MKSVTTFDIVKTKKGYEIFVFWGKRYTFSNLKTAKSFAANANNLLFTELFKLNELYCEIVPLVMRLLFICEPQEKIFVLKTIQNINENLTFCLLPRGQNKTVYIINKIEQSLRDLNELNDFYFEKSKKTSDTISVYKSRTLTERINNAIKDFTNFKYLDLEKIKTDAKTIHLEHRLKTAI